MCPLHSPEPGVYKSRVPCITWEEELLLRGVRPDSELVLLLHPASSSPHLRTESGGVSGLVSSNALLASGGGCGCAMKGWVKDVGLHSEKKKTTLSPLRGFSLRFQGNEKTASPGEESMVGYSSDGGLSSTTRGRAFPVSLSSPGVIVPSLMSTRESLLPPGVQREILPQGSLPPLINEGFKEVDVRSFMPLKGNGPKLTPVTQSRPLSTRVNPICDTETILSGVSSSTVSGCDSLNRKNPSPSGGLKSLVVPASCERVSEKKPVWRNTSSFIHDKKESGNNKVARSQREGLRVRAPGMLAPPRNIGKKNRR